MPKAIAIGAQIQATFAKAYKMGVPIAFGTDSGVSPHGDNAKEFGFMTQSRDACKRSNSISNHCER